MKKYSIIMAVSVIVISCNRSVSLETITELAGDNRGQIEAVLSAFPDDRYRTEAAEFLVKNMIGKFTLDETSVEANQIFFDALIKYRDTHGKYGDTGLYDVADSLERLFGIPKMSPSYTNDLKTIKADFLIRHIDESVKTWENSPWKNNVSFDVFCRYVLPYRETELWWEGSGQYFRDKYADSLSVWHSLTMFEASARIEAAVRAGFHEDGQYFIDYAYLSPTKFQNTLRAGAGVCRDANSVVITALRTFGIPAAMDRVPYWGNSNASHFWTEVIGKPSRGLYDNGQKDFHTVEDEIVNDSYWFKIPLPADSTGIPSNIQLRKTRSVPKIYRGNYAFDFNSPVLSVSEAVPQLFQEATLSDITKQYVVTRDISVKVDSPEKRKFAYLCCYVPDTFDWTPVAIGTIMFGRAKFRDIGVNVLYTLAVCSGNGLMICGEPFVLEKSGKVRYLEADESIKEAGTMYSKVPLRTNVIYYALTMRGDEIYAVRGDNLSDTLKINTINAIPYYSQDINFSEAINARKIIYKFNNDGPKFLGELQFFEKDANGKETLIEGTPFGNPCLSTNPLDKAFDGSFVTFAFLDKSPGNVDYIGLDFGRERKVSSMMYCPRNDDNAIVQGELYELFYWSDGWRSLGKQTGGKDRRLHYTNIPTGALLRIHNHTRGKENRPFTLENGIQVWW